MTIALSLASLTKDHLAFVKDLTWIIIKSFLISISYEQMLFICEWKDMEFKKGETGHILHRITNNSSNNNNLHHNGSYFRSDCVGPCSKCFSHMKVYSVFILLNYTAPASQAGTCTLQKVNSLKMKSPINRYLVKATGPRHCWNCIPQFTMAFDTKQ